MKLIPESNLCALDDEHFHISQTAMLMNTKYKTNTYTAYG
jgi:hypothetical protein